MITYLIGAVGIFSPLYSTVHRSIFQRFEQPSSARMIFFSAQAFARIKWLEKNAEFELENKMYDVSRIVRSNGGFVVYCDNDELEERFITFFNAWKNTNSTPGTEQLKAQFHPQFCSPLPETSVTHISNPQFDLDAGVKIYDSPGAQDPSPPPEHLC